KADAPIPIVDLPKKVGKRGSDVVRAALDKLITHLGVFEDLDPNTWDIVVGLLPGVREGLIRAERPRERPPLVACDAPREFGLQASPEIDDLRTVLLEVASQPARLRRDSSLFQKER